MDETDKRQKSRPERVPLSGPVTALRTEAFIGSPVALDKIAPIDLASASVEGRPERCPEFIEGLDEG